MQTTRAGVQCAHGPGNPFQVAVVVTASWDKGVILLHGTLTIIGDNRKMSGQQALFDFHVNHMSLAPTVNLVGELTCISAPDHLWDTFLGITISEEVKRHPGGAWEWQMADSSSPNRGSQSSPIRWFWAKAAPMSEAASDEGNAVKWEAGKMIPETAPFPSV